MSFAQLQSSRRAKETKSFVSTTNTQEKNVDISTDSEPQTSHIVPRSRSADRSQGPTSHSISLLGMYQNIPDTLEVRQSEETGRGLYAKTQYNVGSVLLSVRPQVSVLSGSHLEHYCSFCASAAPPHGLKRCTKCRKVWYCNASCQNADWAMHKLECNALQRWEVDAPSPELALPSDAVRCIGRVLWGIQKFGLESIWTREFNGMQSHRSSLPPSAFESHTYLAHSVVRYLGISSPTELAPFGLSSAGDLVDLISRFTTNTFTLTSPSLSPIGVCVSPTMALVNHSCDPNVVMVFPHASDAPTTTEPLMHLVALREILPGEQVYVSYVDISVSREARQKELKDVYNFTCRCSACSNQGKLDPRASVYCPKSCGGLCPLPTEENESPRCGKCNSVITSPDAILDALHVGSEGLEKAMSLQFKDPSKSRQLTSNLIPIMTSAALTPSTHPLLALTRLHMELLLLALPDNLTQEYLDEVIRTAAKYNAGLSNILPVGHPVRGVALAELGKLLAVDEPSPHDLTDTPQPHFPPSGIQRLKLALQTLVRAREELYIGYGKGNGGGQVGKEVREVIVRLEGELGAWSQGIKNVIEDARAAGQISK
ncbi:hypothetical protein QCA50_013389 [Cerrena zonata]|uniref:SET domain-containing protein n=1 Tax=Cerrena zonata TaxID=2478898 RepID=A0AAW0FWT4_9APHY